MPSIRRPHPLLLAIGICVLACLVVAETECPQANLVKPNSYASLSRKVMMLGGVSSRDGTVTYVLENIGDSGITMSSLTYPGADLKSISFLNFIQPAEVAEARLAVGTIGSETGVYIFHKNALHRVDPAKGSVDVVAGRTNDAVQINGSSADQTTAADARFGAAAGIAVGGGKVFIADTDNHCVRVLEGGHIKGGVGMCNTGSANGSTSAPAHLIRSPSRIAVAADGLTLFIQVEGDDGKPSLVTMMYGVPLSLKKVVLQNKDTHVDAEKALDAVVAALMADLQLLDVVDHPLIDNYLDPSASNAKELVYAVSASLPCTLVLINPEAQTDGTFALLLLTSQKSCGTARPRAVVNTNGVIYDVLENREPLSFSGACLGVQPPPGEVPVGEERLILIVMIVITCIVVLIVATAVIRFRRTKPADHHEVDVAAATEMEEADRNRTIAAMYGVSEPGGSDLGIARPGTSGSNPPTTMGNRSDTSGERSNHPQQRQQQQQQQQQQHNPREEEMPLPPPKDVSTYQKMKLIGRGGNGSVYSAMLEDGSIVAMKEMLMSPGDEDSLITLQQEVQMLSSLRHPYVVEYYDSRYEKDEMRFLLFMELISSGTLSATVRNLREHIKEEVAKIYVRQIVEGLTYIHSKGVVHRDIKCDNVLLTQEGVCKLADFGASKTIGNTAGASRAANTMIGTPHFMAPEVLMGAISDKDDAVGYGKKADVWSLGIMCLELLNKGEMPWPKFASQGVAFVHISSPEGKPLIPGFLSDCCKDFIKQCCNRNPQKRPTCEELLLHEWIAYVPLKRSTRSIGSSGNAQFNDVAADV